MKYQTLQIRLNQYTLLILLLLFSSPFIMHAQRSVEGSIRFDRLNRSYIAYIPSSYTGNKAVPLVLNFHGFFNSAAQQVTNSNFNQIAEREGFIVVYPQGSRDRAGINHFNVGWGNSNRNDVGFTNALLDQVERTYRIDTSRIYSTGFSNGGFFSHKLACELSDRIAAIASVSGSITRGQLRNCNPSHPMPVLQIHGTSDLVVPYFGTLLFESVRSVLDYWKDFNRTRNRAITTKLPNISRSDLSTVVLKVYEGGRRGVKVEHYRIDNGDHSWPGVRESGPFSIFLRRNFDINASERIWDFFSQYDLNGRIDSAGQKLADAKGTPRISIYPNPVSDQLTIQHDLGKNQTYTLSGLQGQIIQQGRLDSYENLIDTSSLQNGIYVLAIGTSTFKIVKGN